MKIKFNLLSFLILLLFTGSFLQAQDLDDYLYKIDLKLRKDKKYLNLNYFDISGNDAFLKELGALARADEKQPFEFKKIDGVSYRFVFLREAIGVDTMVLLYVTETTQSGGVADTSVLIQEGSAKSTEATVMYFKDIYFMKEQQPEYYASIIKYLDRYQKNDPENKFQTLLQINPDTDIKTSLGITSRDNQDFLNFMRSNSIQWYPKEVKKGVVDFRGASGGDSVTSAEYRIDAGFSSIAFAHRFMDFSIGGAGLELSVENKAMNVLPWQDQTVTAGFRTLINVADKEADFKNSLILDARLFGRVKLNLLDISKGLPFKIGGVAKLNFGNAAGIDLNLTRAFGMPFLNLYASVGSSGYTDPLIRSVESPTTDVAYFSFTQAMGSYSFYWNTSDKMTSRFRLDVGWGYYDIYKAIYPTNSKYQSSIVVVQESFSPMVQLNFNFAPKNIDLLGTAIRVYDSQVMINTWIKLLELDGGHVFRAQTTAISAPLFRSPRGWETKDIGLFFQIRYRYGL